MHSPIFKYKIIYDYRLIVDILLRKQYKFISATITFIM